VTSEVFGAVFIFILLLAACTPVFLCIRGLYRAEKEEEKTWKSYSTAVDKCVLLLRKGYQPMESSPDQTQAPLVKSSCDPTAVNTAAIEDLIHAVGALQKRLRHVESFLGLPDAAVEQENPQE